MDLPQYEAGDASTFARGAVFSRPWRTVTLSSSPTTEGYQARVRLDHPAQTGVLVEAFGPGVTGRFDAALTLTLDLYFGGLSSAGRLSVLNGQNRMAILAANGAWEIIGFQSAEEIAAGRWQVSKLLRGLNGTTDAMLAGAVSGAPVVALNAAVKPLGLSADETGRMINWIAERGGQTAPAAGPFAFAGGLRAETPVAPVHLRARRIDSGDIRMTWIRCARRDADHWLDGDIALDEPLESYRIDILDGATVKRSFDVSGQALHYAAGLEIEDFGAPQAVLSIRVRQRGQKVTFGVPAQALLSL